MRNYDRPASRQPKLVLAQFALLNSTGILKIVGSIELIVAQEFPEGAMQFVGAGFDRGIENRGSGAAELGTEARGFNSELINRVDRRKNDVVRTVQEIHGVRVVVNAIEQVIVLRRPISIGGEGAAGGIASCVRLGGVHTRGELRQKCEIPPIQREVIHTARVDDLTHSSVLGLQNRNRSLHLDGLGHRAGWERDISNHVSTYVNRYILFRDCLETLEGSGDLIAPNSERR